MDRVFVFLIRNDIWIYVLCALALFWYTTEFVRAQRGLRSAVFGLERERGLSKRNNALVFMGIFSAIIAVVFFVNRQIAPTLPAELLKPPTPTPDARRTPLSRPTAQGTPQKEGVVITPNLAPTVTLQGQAPEGDAGEFEAATATPTPYVPPTPFVDCNNDLIITDPRNGAAVSGEISVFGTADTAIFDAFILETNGPQTNGQWASLLGRSISQPVREGFLGSVNLSAWEPGPYLVRLTTLDAEENVIGQCVIQVTLTGNS
jgi:hypothetical protein